MNTAVPTLMEELLEEMTLELVGCSDADREYWIDQWNEVNLITDEDEHDGNYAALHNIFAYWVNNGKKFPEKLF